MAVSTARQRELLEGSANNFEEQLFTLGLERRTQERLLAAAEGGKLRMARYTPKHDNSNAPTAIRGRLAQLEFDIERIEYALEDARAELAALPVEEDG